MITIQTLIKTKHAVKQKKGESVYTKAEILGKSYAAALEAISELVPEFNMVTFYVTQDSDSMENLSDNLLWREEDDTFKIYDLSPTKKGLKDNSVTALYYLYDPESASKEKIIVNLN